MAQAKSKAAPKKGDNVNVIAGEHKGRVGVLKSVRAATSSGTVELENGQSVGVKLDDLAAA